MNTGIKRGLKVMCIAVSLIATSACIPATAAPAVVKNDTAQVQSDKTPSRDYRKAQ